MNVAENLFEYLKRNDLAEIPGLGTFVVKSSSARINDITGTILPPSRQVTFLKEENQDMSFVNFMAENEFISQQTALTWIRQYADSVVEKLQQGRTITIGHLGKLTKGLLDEYKFQAADGLNLLDDSFALGELKNVKMYKSEDEVIEPIRTKPTLPIEEPEQEDCTQQLQDQIDQAEQISEAERSQESSQETQTRIIQHTEAVVDSDTTAPIAQEEITETLDVDATPNQDKTQQTIDVAEQGDKNIVVEDIIPAEQPEEEAIEHDDMTQDMKEIVRRHSSTETEQEQEPKKKKGKSKFWKVLFWIILVIILLCAAFVGAHWMGWLKDVKFLKPVTDKLAYYIPVREAKPQDKTATITTMTNTDEPIVSIEEVSPTEQAAPEIPYEAPIPMQNGDNKATKKPATTPAAKTNKNTATTNNTTSKPAILVEDNTPVLTQTYSKLGFDVVDADTYTDKKRAEQQARKAKSLGYDSYILSKIKSGTPIYYVSYGSRRTMDEASNLMQNMQVKLGGRYAIINR